MTWIGAMAHNKGAVAGAAGWALFLVIVAAACAMDGIALTDTAAVAAAGKLSPRLTGQEHGGREGALSVLIRTDGPVGAPERRALRAAGVDVDAVAGDLVTGRVPTRCLGRLAALGFVRYVEPGRRLPPERKQAP